MRIFAILFSLLVIHHETAIVNGGPNERKLLHVLLDMYNTLERPVAVENQHLTVWIRLSLHQIFQLYDNYDKIQVMAGIGLTWVDNNLMWNTSEFGNVNVVRIPPHRIWKPDVLVHNEGESPDPTFSTTVRVFSSGQANFEAPGQVQTRCPMLKVNWPFDEHSCDIIFSSFTYDVKEVDLVLAENATDLSNLKESSLYQLLDFRVERYEETDSFSGITKALVKFTIKVRRKGEATYRHGMILITISAFLLLLTRLVGMNGRLLFSLAPLAFCVAFLYEYSPKDTTLVWEMSSPLLNLGIYLTRLACFSLCWDVVAVMLLTQCSQMPSWLQSITQMLRKMRNFFAYIPNGIPLTVTRNNEKLEDDLATPEGSFQAPSQDKTGDITFLIACLDRIFVLLLISILAFFYLFVAPGVPE